LNVENICSMCCGLSMFRSSARDILVLGSYKYYRRILRAKKSSGFSLENGSLHFESSRGMSRKLSNNVDPNFISFCFYRRLFALCLKIGTLLLIGCFSDAWTILSVTKSR
jgi:hypothetical protein